MIYLQRALLVLLLTTHVTWSAIVTAQSHTNLRSWTLLRDTLPFSQAGLLVAWFVVGPLPRRYRWPLVLLFGGLCYLTAGNGALPILAAQSVAILAVLTLFRAWRRQRVQVAEALVEAPALQFSLRGLLGLTLLAAVALVAGRFLHRAYAGQFRIPELPVVLLVAASFATITLVGLWAFLTRGRPGLRGLVFAVVTPAVGAALPLTLAKRSDVPVMLVWMCLHGIIIGLSLLALRFAGFQFVSTQAVSQPETSPQEVTSPRTCTQPLAGVRTEPG